MSDPVLNEIAAALADIVNYLENKPEQAARTDGVEALGRIVQAVSGLAEIIGRRESIDLAPVVQALSGLKLSATFSPQITVQPAAVNLPHPRGWEFAVRYRANGEIERITAMPS